MDELKISQEQIKEAIEDIPTKDLAHVVILLVDELQELKIMVKDLRRKINNLY